MVQYRGRKELLDTTTKVEISSYQGHWTVWSCLDCHSRSRQENIAKSKFSGCPDGPVTQFFRVCACRIRYSVGSINVCPELIGASQIRHQQCSNVKLEHCTDAACHDEREPVASVDYASQLHVPWHHDLLIIYIS